MSQNPPDLLPELENDDFSALAGKKVALDLEDAPFLMADEPEEKPEPAPQPEAKPEPKPAKGINKLLLIIIAGVVVLLGGAAAAFFLLTREPVEVEPEPERPIIVVPTPTLPNIPPPPQQIQLDTFVIPIFDEQRKTHFLEASLILVLDNALLALEVDEKIVLLRDSIYYYLRNQSYEHLRNPANTQEIKDSLIRAVNDYLSVADVKDIYFDSFLIR